MKSITIICNYKLDPNRVGGMDRFFWSLNKKLLKRNYNVKWIFPDSEGISHYAEQQMHNMICSRQRTIIESAYDYLYESGGCDLAICIFLDYNSSIPAKLKKSGAKRIMVIDQMSRLAKKRSVLHRTKYFLKGLVNYLYIDQIIAVSTFVKSSISHEMGFWWKPKIHVIYNSIDVDLFNSTSTETDRTPYSIFCIAHLIKEKGVQDLIKAVARLPAGYKDKVTLTIAGDGAYKQQLIELSNQYGLAETIHFTGNINNQHIQIRKHEICVVPSLWKEAFGYTNVEAMASGCIVLASAIGGIPEIIQHRINGFLFEPGNSRDLCEQLIEIFDLKQDEKKYLRDAANLKVESTFNLSSNINNYLDKIHKLACT